MCEGAARRHGLTSARCDCCSSIDLHAAPMQACASVQGCGCFRAKDTNVAVSDVRRAFKYVYYLKILEGAAAQVPHWLGELAASVFTPRKRGEKGRFWWALEANEPCAPSQNTVTETTRLETNSSAPLEVKVEGSRHAGNHDKLRFGVAARTSSFLDRPGPVSSPSKFGQGKSPTL